LRTALERLAKGADDLTVLALELAFSSHSHFTDAFCREVGCTPSRLRRDARRHTFRELPKNLEV
jgi:AraC-like DNA-binding protein